MHGIPRYLKTREDFDNVHALALAGGCDTQCVIGHWHGLINTQKAYVFDRALAEGEAADGPEPDYIVLTMEDGSRQQHILAINPAARIGALGYAEVDVQAKINELEAL